MTWRAYAVGLLGLSISAVSSAAEAPPGEGGRTPGAWLEFMSQAFRERSTYAPALRSASILATLARTQATSAIGAKASAVTQ